MEDKARVSDNMDFVKDMNNFTLLNTNKSAVAKHKQKIAELKKAKLVELEINNLKTEVSEIKSMLGQILKAVGGEK
jgi:hypothetical protein